jgi:diguanylate cyclase (GGDEF)-like protein
MAIVVAGLLGLLVLAIGIALFAQRASFRAHRDLERTTRFDVLTGLPNRARLDETLTRVLDEGRQHQGSSDRIGAVILIELSRFDRVNETYGHEVGDGLMKAVTTQLRSAAAPDEQLFRLGGPQFVIIHPGLTDTVAAQRRATELREALTTPYRVGTDILKVVTEVGVAMIEPRHDDPSGVLHDAVIALQQANRSGSDHVIVYDRTMHAELSPASLDRRLREALERDEFWVLYLPVVALDNHELVGVEALLRWADPERGLVGPDEFLRHLDESGLIGPVGDWVVEQACRQNRLWQQAFPKRELLTTINVSPRQLGHPDFLSRVLSIIAATEADPSRICLEITEGTVMRDIESAWRTLLDAKEAGIKLALDDFGTGYSSLSYLQRFSLDILKIDRTFVSGVATSREDAAITQQLVAMAHALDIAPVAEGVDSAEQAQTLHGMGCDFAQGFYFSAPQPVTAIEAMLASGVVRPAAQATGIDWAGGGAKPEQF